MLVLVILVCVMVAGVLLRRDLLTLIAVLVFVNLPYLTNTVWDTRDTNAIYQVFHAFYNEFFFSQRLPLWCPYGTFGQASGYVSGYSLPGIELFFLPLGTLLGIRDTWFLFALANLGAQLVFLLGMFLLSGALLSRRSAIFMVCLAAVGSLAWYWHIVFSIRMIYMFPLVVYFLLLFLEKRRPEFLWIGGLCGVFWAQCSGYLPAIWLFVLLIMAAVLSFSYKTAWLCVFSRSWRNLLCFAVFVLLAGCLAYTAVHSLQHVTITQNNRDPTTGKVHLEDFRHRGGNPNVVEILRAVFALSRQIPINVWDNNLYMGLAPLFFFVWGLCRVRSMHFWALALAALALVWLSFGEAFAIVVYYVFPLMVYFRFLTWIGPLAKVLVILGAGLGFERFWSEGQTMRGGVLILLALLFAIDASHVPVEMVYPQVALYGALTGLATVVAYGVGAWRRNRGARMDIGTYIRIAVLVALAWELALYQHHVDKHLPKLPREDTQAREMVAVRKLMYQEQRTHQPVTATTQYALTRMVITYAVPLYIFLQWDPCKIGSPPGYVQAMSSGTYELLHLHGPDSPGLLNMVGCATPKLRLASQVAYAQDDRQAAALVLGSADVNATPVITLPSTVPMPPATEGFQGLSGDVRVTAFSSNTLEALADVTNEKGAWLVYADSYHPGWHATVNGKRVPIAQADLAFKTIWLPAGRSVVQFWFWDGLASLLAYVLATFSVLASLGLLVWVIKLVVWPAASQRLVLGVADGMLTGQIAVEG